MKVSAPDLYPRKRQGSNTGTHDGYLRENQGICAAILADAIGKSERFVITRQRKLGLRAFSGNLKKGVRYVER